MGSPYVQEGAFSRLKAKGAQAMGALGAMAGHQVQSPAETKLHSLWDGFIASLKGNMRDWFNQVSPMLDQQVPLTNEKQQQVKETLDELSRLLSSVGPKKIGTAPDDYAGVGARTKRRNPDTFVKGSAYNRSTTSPTKLTEMVEEGFWDAAKRDMKLNKALGSNDPSNILDSYKNHVLSLFQKFMQDAVKMTKMTAQQIYSVLAKMQPSQQGWQAAGNMQKVVQNLQTLQSVGDIKGQGEPPVIHPSSSAAEVPPVIQQPPSAQQPTPIPPQKPPEQTSPQQNGAQGVSQGGDGTIQPQEYPYIILHAIKIINGAVQADFSRTGHFFDKNPSGAYNKLPTDFTGPLLTKESKLGWLLKEIVNPPKNKGQEGEKGEGGEEKEVRENPNEFLYNFHSKFSKYPGQPFSVYVPPVGISNEVPGLQGVKIEVIWNCSKYLNRIYVISEKNGKKSSPLMIMQFYDHNVSSQAGATEGGTNQFSVEKIVKDSNPVTGSKLKDAPPEVLNDIHKESETFMRSLMVTTHRKSMEFKAKKSKNVFPLKWDETTGAVFYKDEEGNSQNISQAKVKEKLEGEYEDAQKWAKSLEYFGYFEKFKNLKPMDIEEYPAFEKAQTELLNTGMAENTVNKRLNKAWMTLRKEKAPEKITKEELIAFVNGEPSSDQPETGEVPSAFTDAKMALQKLGHKEQDAIKLVTKAWVNLAATKKAEGKTEKDITADELLQASVSGKKSTPAPAPAPAPAVAPASASTSVSKPAGAPAPSKPPSPPVSGTPSGPVSNTDPQSPVSSPGGSVSNPKTVKLPTIDPETGKMVPVPQQPEQPKPKKKAASQPIEIWKGEDGQMQWTNKAGKIGGLTSQSIAKFQNDPEFQQALKAAKKKGFKSPYTDLKERLVNPFHRDNFLL